MAGRIIKTKKIILSKTLIKNWLNIKKAWIRGLTAFANTLSNLSDKDASEVYEIAKLAPYKNSYVDILRANPELKLIIKNDFDRKMMWDIYDNFSFRLGKKVEEPDTVKLVTSMKSRMAPRIGYWH
ncbi:hypothetical protein HY988_04310 [Candidatus Micrarchaeota archaeon]|nr:hypothetical protein [Candidatus Micrarchaeota archaeon]